MKRFFCDLWNGIGENPKKAMLAYMLFSLVFWTLQCSLLQNILGLDVIETLVWGGEKALGHSKHPPLSGWVSLGFSRLCNYQDWGLYLLCQLMIVCGVYFVYRTARIFLDEYASVTAALGLYFLHYYTPSEMKFCTYLLEMALAPLTVYCFFRAVREKRSVFYLLLGACGALLMLNKYSGALLLLGLFVVFLLTPEYRAELKSFRPYMAVVLLFLLLAPHIFWLVNHDFPCLRHVADRIHEEWNWYDPIVIFSASLYPFAVIGGVMAAAFLACRKQLEKKVPQKSIVRWALILSLIPAVLYCALSLCGKGVIAMWLCSTVSFAGVALAAASPFAFDRRNFRWFFLLLCVVTVCIMTGATADLLINPRTRLHARPEQIIKPALAFWERQSGKRELPVVAGELWYIGVISHYNPLRPAVCDMEEPLTVERELAGIHREGALLVCGKRELFPRLCSVLKLGVIEPVEITYPFFTAAGKSRNDRFYVGYFPGKKQKMLDK